MVKEDSPMKNEPPKMQPPPTSIASMKAPTLAPGLNLDKKSGDKSRPVSSTPVHGTPWCVVWTGDHRVFFYNPSTKTSVWERPPDLIGRADVTEMCKSPAAAEKMKAKNIPPGFNSAPSGNIEQHNKKKVSFKMKSTYNV